MALLVAVIEQYNRLQTEFTLQHRAGWWWAARIALEEAAVLVAIGVCQATHVGHSHAWWFGLAAGAAGPMALRLRVLDYRRGESSIPIGPAAIYEMGRGVVERKIDERGAERQTKWINFELLPKLERADVDPDLLGSYVVDYLRGITMSVVERDREIAYIQGELANPETSRKVKRELLVHHCAYELRAPRVLEQFSAAATE